MAISATAIWSFISGATGGANVNGGFFNSAGTNPGTDYSFQVGAQYNTTTGTAAGAGDLILWAAASADMVRNGAHVISGVNTTAGWYEIIAATPGVSIQLDRAVTTGVATDIVVNVGGAISLAGANDDAVFESMVAGNKGYIKQGTYTLGGTVAISAAGSLLKEIELIGYASSITDAPRGSTRPLIDAGAVAFTYGAFWRTKHVQFTGSSATGVVAAADNTFVDCKFISTGTANKLAFSGTTRSVLIRCELTNPLGYCALGNFAIFMGCYFHDSVTGVRGTSAGNGVRCIDCIFDTLSTAGVDMTAACTDIQIIQDCTFYGGEVAAGVGLQMAAGNTNVVVMNSIFYGCTTAITHGTASQSSCFDFTNLFYNNTNPNTNWTTNSAVTTVNPQFTSGTGGNFAVGNATAAAGGEPGTFPGGLSMAAPAFGAVQGNASSGGSTIVPDLEI